MMDIKATIITGTKRRMVQSSAVDILQSAAADQSSWWDGSWEEKKKMSAEWNLFSIRLLASK